MFVDVRTMQYLVGVDVEVNAMSRCGIMHRHKQWLYQVRPAQILNCIFSVEYTVQPRAYTFYNIDDVRYYARRDAISIHKI